MDKQKGPTGFIVVLPGEVIEIPQDSDKSWLTLFYSLPRELAEKWKPAYDLPRCPYEVLRTDKYDHIVCDDRFSIHKHTELWKSRDARNSKYSYGVAIANTWYWYETWVHEVEKHCEAHKDELKI